MARWRSGNAVDCKSSMRGFDSRPCLKYQRNLIFWYGKKLKVFIGNRKAERVPCGVCLHRRTWSRARVVSFEFVEKTPDRFPPVPQNTKYIWYLARSGIESRSGHQLCPTTKTELVARRGRKYLAK
jgi:hypothetical protein